MCLFVATRMSLAVIDVRENKNSNRRYICEHTFEELTAVCPESRLPDFYTVKITYEPEKELVELKSLKYYLSSFRNVEILHEELINRIVDDLINSIEPRWIVAELQVNVRGGIKTVIKRKWSKERGDELF